MVRWNTIDPLAEINRRWASYDYVEDDPIRLVDPDGMESMDIYGFDGKKHKVHGKDLHRAYTAEEEKKPKAEVDATKTTSKIPAIQPKLKSNNGLSNINISPGYQGTISSWPPPEPVDYNDFGLPSTSLAIGTNVVNTYGAVDGVFELKALFTTTDNFINLANAERTAHIIEGDATGGGHAWFGSLRSFANGISGEKSMFPITWSNEKIMNAVSDVTVNNPWVQQTGAAGAMFTKSGQPVRFVIEGAYEGTRIRVITTSTDIITAFPIK